jgi:hypothetical protein
MQTRRALQIAARFVDIFLVFTIRKTHPAKPIIKEGTTLIDRVDSVPRIFHSCGCAGRTRAMLGSVGSATVARLGYN